MSTIKELEKALKHILVVTYYTWYNGDEILARKKVIESVIGSLRFLGDGISVEDRTTIARHINDNLEILYDDWRKG